MKRSFADNTNNTDTCSISIIDLQKKALDIIRKSKPLIISVDLDFTLWYFFFKYLNHFYLLILSNIFI